MNLCAKQQFVDADKQLNVIYKKVTAKCDAEMRAALVKAQKAWLTYREEHAAMEALLYEGGSMAPMAALNAKTATTQARIKELQDLLSELDL